MTAGALKALLGTASAFALVAACNDRPAPRESAYQGAPVGGDRRAQDAPYYAGLRGRRPGLPARLKERRRAVAPSGSADIQMFRPPAPQGRRAETRRTRGGSRSMRRHPATRKMNQRLRFARDFGRVGCASACPRAPSPPSVNGRFAGPRPLRDLVPARGRTPAERGSRRGPAERER